MDKYTPNQKMFYQRKKKEKKNSKPTNLFELYICIQQAIVCGWMMIIDVVNFLSNILIYVSPCKRSLEESKLKAAHTQDVCVCMFERFYVPKWLYL